MDEEHKKQSEDVNPPPLFDAVDDILDEDSGQEKQNIDVEIGGTPLSRPREENLDNIVQPGDPQHKPEKIRDDLGAFQRLLYDNRLSSMSKKQAIKIARVMFDAEYQQIVHVVTLGLDISKKQAFVQYMNSTKALQVEIQRTAGDAVENLTGVLMDVRYNAYENANEQKKRVLEQYRRGTLNEKQGRDELEMVDNLLKERLEDALETYQSQRTNFKSHIQRTLELFKDDLKKKQLL